MIINLKSQISNLKSLNRGFTLVETIIYVAIVSIILVSISYLILDILGSQTKNTAQLEVSYNLKTIANFLRQDIKAAQNINSLSGQTFNLAMAGDDITYNFDLGNRQITRQVGSLSPAVINTNQVMINGSFFDFSYLARSKNVGINLMIEYKNPDNLPDYNASTTIDFAVELRGRR
ncbi:MAG: hypothetical protein A2729_00065 [Candidatus Buchananbacteria bacterium RIFCSPHIGHO2_01_FULL_39_14]|uniref:Prepilin-type N-terminal cleavage/methylation domain-containing protein n=2 Tax=Candidatus Buchananiibacteriota TaxID=1817903 RepID=A0A1G1YVK6_9BACT|nr:MAG: hypothetical protein A2729_00065 [Candidatus Buchananbacteria bacterium RIFCSPHIGHO2_01_FULL_39_14]OGY49392.1 MAG: hypothetical protein A3D39_00735 [Candidatus Buchananbacteria bacterium RIFCSPHIGHO2_02_FULL_39_17]OGY55610.1 MAG: hypothetical protein A2912_05370 [Candidatus Buchananbacteria bacterium RIFCSPLOWO2_01_FULL_40_23b]